MAKITGIVTIRSLKHSELMFSADDKLDGDRRHVSTWIGRDRPPLEACQWNIVQCGLTYRIQNVMTKEWMYANGPKLNSERRRVLTFNRGDADPPLDDLSYQWHIVPFGASFGFKNVKYDEWLYANDPKLSDKCRHVLTWIPGGHDPKSDQSRCWVIELVNANNSAPKAVSDWKHDIKHPCKHVLIQSSGFQSGNKAIFHLDGAPIDFKTSRGLNVVILDPASLQVLSKRSYDIFASYGDRNQLAADVQALSSGHIFLAALKDSGMEKLSHAETLVLQEVGATISEGKYREGYALIGMKGGRAVAEAQGNAVTATGNVGSPISPTPAVTLKLKHRDVFYRVSAKKSLEFNDFKKAVATAIGKHFAGIRAMYIDDDGDYCIINKATLPEFMESARNDADGKCVLKVQLKDLDDADGQARREREVEDTNDGHEESEQ